jgi:uncharacterized membrane protein HdeD (DUF308 family)
VKIEMELTDQKKTSMWVRIAEIIAGIIVIALGVLAWLNPISTGIALVSLLGIALIILGIVEFVRIFDHGISGWQRLLNLILSIILIVLAAMVLGNILLGFFTLTFLLGLALLFAGLVWCTRGTAGAIIVGILGIIAGFIVMINPVIGGWTMVALTGVFVIIFGLELLVSGFLGRWV